ncbi:dihydrofolate reductase [Paenibacillus sp. YPG26]|uniref:dihydrofolate reductase n=1 Tax=Paenibacillus sp. YPG26 TaxID=2878915 RepID=UPI00203C2826|nr:dihydrofolate reductase [Paenibacillus sp. YPG26]USB34926.1 dihydrofolate reductase [Paenibacillus sp. YPG26]
MGITLIWAMAQGGVIGKDNKLPWRLPADLAFFKAQTLGKTMIMGRKTWESIGSKPLPGRHNVVLTLDERYIAEGGVTVHSIHEALDLQKQNEELMVIGGAGVFQHFLPYADKLLVTFIDEEIEGDVVFPQFDWSEFRITEEIQGVQDEKNRHPYRFVTYERIRSAAQ